MVPYFFVAVLDSGFEQVITCPPPKLEFCGGHHSGVGEPTDNGLVHDLKNGSPINPVDTSDFFREELRVKEAKWGDGVLLHRAISLCLLMVRDAKHPISPSYTAIAFRKREFRWCLPELPAC